MRTLTESLLVARGEEVLLADARRDAPFRSRTFTIADELGTPEPLAHPQPRPIDVLVSLGAAFAAIVVVLLGIAAVLVVIGGMRP